jgi:hypothetical protein
MQHLGIGQSSQPMLHEEESCDIKRKGMTIDLDQWVKA